MVAWLSKSVSNRWYKILVALFYCTGFDSRVTTGNRQGWSATISPCEMSLTPSGGILRFFLQQRIMRAGQQDHIDILPFFKNIVKILFYKKIRSMIFILFILDKRYPHRTGFLVYIQFREELSNFHRVRFRCHCSIGGKYPHTFCLVKTYR